MSHESGSLPLHDSRGSKSRSELSPLHLFHDKNNESSNFDSTLQTQTTAVAMSDVTELKCWPCCIDSITWSPEGIIALASDDRVELLVRP